MCRRRSLTVSNIRWQKWSKTTFCHTHVLYLVTGTKALLISALNSCNKQHKYKEHNFSLRFFLTIKQEVLSMDNFLRDRSSDMKTYFFSYLVSRNSTSEHSRKYLWVFQVRKFCQCEGCGYIKQFGWKGSYRRQLSWELPQINYIKIWRNLNENITRGSKQKKQELIW